MPRESTFASARARATGPGRLALAASATLGLLLATSDPAAAQAVERALYVSVIDDKGAPVTSVQPDDLDVREDGVRREVLRVVPASEPMQIALLVDNSQAATDDISNLRRAVEAFVAAVAPAHQVALVTLGDRPTIMTEATGDPAALKQGVGRLFAQPGSGTYLLDALVEAAAGFKKREPARPVIVSVTIDAVEFSNANYLQALDALKGSYASYDALVLLRPTSAGTDTEERRNRAIVLDRGTHENGGARRDLLTSMSLEDALTSLARELLNRVKVVYARPPSLIPPDRVTVAAVRQGWTARGVPARPERER